MKRLLCLMIFIIGGIGIVLFNVKYKVVSLEQELSNMRRDIYSTRQSIHILKAEWEHLNNPLRLQKLAQKYLSLIPLDHTHYMSLSQIPFREDAVLSFVTDSMEEEGILEKGAGQGTESFMQEKISLEPKTKVRKTPKKQGQK